MEPSGDSVNNFGGYVFYHEDELLYTQGCGRNERDSVWEEAVEVVLEMSEGYFRMGWDETR